MNIKVEITDGNENSGFGYYRPGMIGTLIGFACNNGIVLLPDGRFVKVPPLKMRAINDPSEYIRREDIEHIIKSSRGPQEALIKIRSL